jgi:hypothetical protein
VGQLRIGLAMMVQVVGRAKVLLAVGGAVLLGLACVERPSEAQECPNDPGCNAVLESLVIPSRFSAAANHVFKGEASSPDGLFMDEGIAFSFNRSWDRFGGAGRDDPTEPMASLGLESYWNGNAEVNFDISPPNSSALLRPFGIAAAYNGSGVYFAVGGSPYSSGSSGLLLYAGKGPGTLFTLTDQSGGSASNNLLQMSRQDGSASVAWRAGGVPRVNFALQQNSNANWFSNFGVLKFRGEWDYGEPVMEFESTGVSATLLRSVPAVTDSAPRFMLLAGGNLQWGSGSAATDTDLYRSAASTLRTDGSLVVAGNLAVMGQKSALVTTASYGQRELYAVESPGEWFEDFGTARVVGAQAIVRIDPVFNETISTHREYHVFLTPNGRCTLYVADKEPDFFKVKRLAGSRGCAFDYRIVARRRGHENARLAEIIDTLATKTK